MKKRTFFYALAFLMLIIDSQTAADGVRIGLRLCLQTLIPALFPFLMLSTMLTGLLSGQTLAICKPLCRLFHIPETRQEILVIGFLGGYPTGAQAVNRAVSEGRISRENGKKLLAFCSNAGPSFIFGMGSTLFPHPWMCWALWGIHILSALLVSQCFPLCSGSSPQPKSTEEITLAKALNRSIRVMAIICGWVILFRVLLSFGEQWLLWRFPIWIQCLLCGVLELSNGICALAQLESIPLRFLLFSSLLGFGGVCVAMQTYSVTADLDPSRYLPGKFLQSLFSAMLAASLFSREMAILSIGCILFILVLRKKRIAFPFPVMYNGEKSSGRKRPCFSAKRSNPNAPIASTPQS